MIEVTRTIRASIGAGQSRTSPSVTVPTGGYRTLRVAIDLSDADQIDPTKVITLVIEASPTGSSPWTFWGSCRTRGENVAQRQAKFGDPEIGLPWLQVPCPPAGHRVRGTATVGAAAVSFGIIVMVE